MSQEVTGRGEPGAPSNHDRLESWKEIAAYLSRDERTVRRWEKREGLPVHRHVHQKQATVYAYRSELDSWRQARGTGLLNHRSASIAVLHINWFRLGWGALLWWAAYNILTGATWAMWLRRLGLSSFHPLLGQSSPPGFARAATFLALTFAMGLSGMGLYAIICSRYGKRPTAPVWAGLALWWLVGLMPGLPDIFLSTVPLWPLACELTSKLLVIVCATLAGAAVYRPPVPHLPSPSAVGER
jgi:hypothetical protein